MPMLAAVKIGDQHHAAQANQMAGVIAERPLCPRLSGNRATAALPEACNSRPRYRRSRGGWVIQCLARSGLISASNDDTHIAVNCYAGQHVAVAIDEIVEVERAVLAARERPVGGGEPPSGVRRGVIEQIQRVAGIA